MKPILAQLDRWLDRKGEIIILRRIFGTGPTTGYTEIRVPAFVKPLTIEELTGTINQQNFFVIMSPTHIRRQQWAAGKPVTSATQLIPRTDPLIPIANEKVIARGRTRNIERVAAVYEGDECIRIELNALG